MDTTALVAATDAAFVAARQLYAVSRIDGTVEPWLTDLRAANEQLEIALQDPDIVGPIGDTGTRTLIALQGLEDEADRTDIPPGQNIRRAYDAAELVGAEFYALLPAGPVPAEEPA